MLKHLSLNKSRGVIWVDGLLHSADSSFDELELINKNKTSLIKNELRYLYDEINSYLDRTDNGLKKGSQYILVGLALQRENQLYYSRSPISLEARLLKENGFNIDNYRSYILSYSDISSNQTLKGFLKSLFKQEFHIMKHFEYRGFSIFDKMIDEISSEVLKYSVPRLKPQINSLFSDRNILNDSLYFRKGK